MVIISEKCCPEFRLKRPVFCFFKFHVLAVDIWLFWSVYFWLFFRNGDNFFPRCVTARRQSASIDRHLEWKVVWKKVQRELEFLFYFSPPFRRVHSADMNNRRSYYTSKTTNIPSVFKPGSKWAPNLTGGHQVRVKIAIRSYVHDVCDAYHECMIECTNALLLAITLEQYTQLKIKVS